MKEMPPDADVIGDGIMTFVFVEGQKWDAKNEAPIRMIIGQRWNLAPDLSGGATTSEPTSPSH
jgi:hypothetical protein